MNSGEKMIVNYRELDDEYVFIDVRTPKEYQEGTIGGAYNIPLFSNEERAEIGTVYKQESVELAKKMAIEAVSKRLPEIYEKATWILHNHKKVALFCARGGMRSQTLGSLLNAMGFKVKVVKDGYKGYRKVVIEDIEKYAATKRFVVLHGNTGVGKTYILNNLTEKGLPVLDIEGAAKHRGSLLGKVGIEEDITQKNFEHVIYSELKSIADDYVVVEAESKRLGKVIIPDCVMNSMASGDHIFVDADIDFRCDIIVSEYMEDERNFEHIYNLLHMFKKQIGEADVNMLKELMEKEDYKSVAKYLMLYYYDPKYMHKAKEYEYIYNLNVGSIEEASKELMDFLLKTYNN